MSTKLPNTPYATLRSKKRISLADTSPIPAPLAIYLEPTNICNFKCVYCPESFANFEEKSGGLHQLDLPAFIRVADQIRELGVPKVLNFYMMGEPFANPRTVDFIRLAAASPKLGERICVTSNGSLLRSATIAAILDSGIDYLRISIYGGTQESHAQRTGSKVRLEKIVQSVKAIHTLRQQRGISLPHIYVKMIDSGDPVENRSFISLFETICDEVAVEPVMNWNDPEGVNLSQQPPESLLNTEHFQHKKSACPFPFYTLVIHSDLRVSPCCVDWDKKAVVGDLKTDTLAAIWNGKRMLDFRLEHLRGNRQNLEACARCTYLYTVPDSVDTLTPSAYLSRRL